MNLDAVGCVGSRATPVAPVIPVGSPARTPHTRSAACPRPAKLQSRASLVLATAYCRLPHLLSAGRAAPGLQLATAALHATPPSTPLSTLKNAIYIYRV